MSAPDLNEMLVFAQVVRGGSFTAAARELAMPKSTVSRKVTDLEARLGARLLQRTTRAERVENAQGDAIDPKIPVVVLVDGGSASASEIVTGALRDRHRATVVGVNTFGKGLVQEVEPLSNGGYLDLTVANYYLPGGKTITTKGIKPQVKAVDKPRTKRDEALPVALDVLVHKL